MIRWPIAFVGISLVIGFAAPSARAALVTYDFVDVITFGGRQFTGSFTYDTVTTVVSNANLQSSGDPTENWVATNFTTFNGNTFYDGAPIIDFGIDLTFASQSALFPASDDGDIVGFTFYNPLDGVPNSLDGVSGDAVVASYEYTAGPFPGSTGFLFAAEIATGCVAPAGVSIIVGGGPGTPTCALAGAFFTDNWHLFHRNPTIPRTDSINFPES